MYLGNVILDAIADEVIKTHGVNAFLSRKYIIKDILSKLEPTTPEDNTHGFIAYDVPDKDRRKMKIGRFLTRKLDLNDRYLNDVSLRKIADFINEKINPNLVYRLDCGNDIHRNYRNRIGGESCMTGSDADKIGMYVKNPDVYRQIILEYGNDSTRAMIIKLDNGMILMDRIFSTSEFLISKMREIAKKNKWHYRKHTSAGYPVICDYEGMDVADYSDFVVSNLIYEDGEVPYQDTLTRYKLSGNKISLMHGYSGLKCDGIVDSTNGYIPNQYTCPSCDENVGEDNLFYSEITGNSYCEACWNGMFTLCDRCEEYCLDEDMVHIADVDERWCEDCVENYARRCVDCGEGNVKDYEIIEDLVFCLVCADKKYKCCKCNEHHLELNNNDLCRDCQSENVETVV